MKKKQEESRPFVEIPIQPEHRERFLKGCEHYGMKVIKPRGRGDVYYTVYYSDAMSLWWLAINLYAPVPETVLTKRSF